MKKFLSLFTAVLLTATAFGQDIQLNGTVSAENNQVKNVADPTEDQDAVTKAYADNLISNFGYQQWSENQVWNDNTTISPEPNSFWFINAENPTITLPPLANQGDVIKIYYMGAGINNFSEEHTVYIDAETNGVFMGFQGNSNYFVAGFAYNFGGVKPFKIEYGLNEFIQIGDYWMLGELESRYDDFDFDNDGYSSDQGDCNDSDASIFPGASEVEDGIDNDCDGVTDEDEGFYDFGGTVTDQDDNTYDYLIYGGDLVWTVENAEMVTYRDGTPIPQVTDNTEWANLTTGAWCYYDNDPTKGKLYNWYAVAGIHDNDPTTPDKELAPEGWHVSSREEWSILITHIRANPNYVDLPIYTVSKAMSSTTGWNSSTQPGAPGNDQSLNNSSGFNAFPEGTSTPSNVRFSQEGNTANFWTSDEGYFKAWYSDTAGGIGDGFSISLSGFSVRFVRD